MDRRQLLDAFRNLDRRQFLDKMCQDLAGLDEPLPIGHGQPLSQPTLVLEMTALLDPEPGSRVLEIGTGSGYQTALLAPFSQMVCTVERIPELARQAEERLVRLGYANVRFRTGNGGTGWPEEAPFDRIIVTAAAGTVPPPLVGQLASPGRMVIPVGPRGWQNLLLITKDAAGKLAERVIEKVAFVELVGAYGWHQAKDNS
ncbi:MAG: protein-L-isoaspartate(D-aspartate) O-methyltransferase [Clostridiaceae bacterium]|nr:protein-L-isoaspartate(D-aspartate) O-methyltransferase [Clostridiaceae bacterium]